MKELKNMVFTSLVSVLSHYYYYKELNSDIMTIPCYVYHLDKRFN